MRLNRLQRLDDNVLDSVHHCLEVDAYFLEVVLELCQVPLRSVLSIVFFRPASIGSRVLDVVLILLVDRIIGEMDVALVHRLLTICVLLSGKTNEAFLE